MRLECAQRIRTQHRHDKNKLCALRAARCALRAARCALHALEVECISKGKARKPYEFRVKVSPANTHHRGSG